MSILSWGKCKLQKTDSTSGAPGQSATWTDLNTPKEDSTKLTPTAGAETIATEEGGETVDARYAKNTYVLEWDEFVKKGSTRSFTAADGIVSGEFAFRVIPEDNSCEGIQIDRAVVRAEESFNTKDGILIHYTAKCLKPATGNTIKPYTAGNGTNL